MCKGCILIVKPIYGRKGDKEWVDVILVHIIQHKGVYAGHNPILRKLTVQTRYVAHAKC